MSRLYASIDSDARKTLATSRGHKRIDTHVRGWDSGVRIVASTEGDEDVFDLYRTSGSNGGANDEHIGTLRSGYGNFILSLTLDPDYGESLTKS